MKPIRIPRAALSILPITLAGLIAWNLSKPTTQGMTAQDTSSPTADPIAPSPEFEYGSTSCQDMNGDGVCD